MKRTQFFVFTVFFLLVLTSCKNEINKQEEKGVKKEDTIVKEELVPANKALIAEWSLDNINNQPRKGLNVNFLENGVFEQVEPNRTVKGSYVISDDGKQIKLKSDVSNDTWTIVEINDTVLVVSAIVNDEENLYKFKK